MLDFIASQKLRTPPLWELAQWKRAKTRHGDVAGWERMFDELRFCYAHSGALEVLDAELRRPTLWCGGASPASAASAGVPTELTRNTYYLRKTLFSWMRAEYYTPNAAGTLVDAFSDFVLAPAEGGASDNARSVNAAHTFLQGLNTNKVAIPAVSAAFGGRVVAAFVNTAPNLYDSTLPAVSWKFAHDGTGVLVAAVAALPLGGTAVNTILGTIRQQDLLTDSGASFAVYDGNAGDPLSFQVGRGGNPPCFGVDSAASGITANTAVVLSARYSESDTPECTTTRNATTLFTGASSAAPSSANPLSTMRIGSNRTPDLGRSLSGSLADVFFAKGSSLGGLLSVIRRYSALRYGTQ